MDRAVQTVLGGAAGAVISLPGVTEPRHLRACCKLSGIDHYKIRTTVAYWWVQEHDWDRVQEKGFRGDECTSRDLAVDTKVFVSEHVIKPYAESGQCGSKLRGPEGCGSQEPGKGRGTESPSQPPKEPALLTFRS